MTSFLNTIKSIAVPVAQVAAQLLPLVLAAAKTRTNANDAVTTGMVRWLADDIEQKIYAANTTEERIVLAFSQQTPNEAADGEYDVETFATTITPLNAYDATAAVRAYGEGAVSTNYLHPAPEDEAAVSPAAAQIVKHLPLLAAVTFPLFGGGIRVERGSQNGVDYWEIKSTARIDWLSFTYRTAMGTLFNFNERPAQPPSLREEYVYRIDMTGPNQSTGILTDFSLTIEGEQVQLAKLLKEAEQIPFARLPDHLRTQLAA